MPVVQRIIQNIKRTIERVVIPVVVLAWVFGTLAVYKMQVQLFGRKSNRLENPKKQEQLEFGE